MEWISVEDRLPADYKMVIVDGGWGFYDIRWFDRVRGRWCTLREISWDGIYRMPLTAPPKMTR